MFTRILLAVDETKETHAAVEAVLNLASGVQTPPRVHVLHVLERGSGWAASYDLESSADANATVAAAQTELAGATVEATGDVMSGEADEIGMTIAKTAAELGCDLVVVSRGQSDLRPPSWEAWPTT